MEAYTTVEEVSANLETILSAQRARGADASLQSVAADRAAARFASISDASTRRSAQHRWSLYTNYCDSVEVPHFPVSAALVAMALWKLSGYTSESGKAFDTHVSAINGVRKVTYETFVGQPDCSWVADNLMDHLPLKNFCRQSRQSVKFAGSAVPAFLGLPQETAKTLPSRRTVKPTAAALAAAAASPTSSDESSSEKPSPPPSIPTPPPSDTTKKRKRNSLPAPRKPTVVVAETLTVAAPAPPPFVPVRRTVAPPFEAIPALSSSTKTAPPPPASVASSSSSHVTRYLPPIPSSSSLPNLSTQSHHAYHGIYYPPGTYSPGKGPPISPKRSGWAAPKARSISSFAIPPAEILKRTFSYSDSETFSNEDLSRPPKSDEIPVSFTRTAFDESDEEESEEWEVFKKPLPTLGSGKGGKDKRVNKKMKVEVVIKSQKKKGKQVAVEPESSASEEESADEDSNERDDRSISSSAMDVDEPTSRPPPQRRASTSTAKPYKRKPGPRERAMIKAAEAARLAAGGAPIAKPEPRGRGRPKSKVGGQKAASGTSKREKEKAAEPTTVQGVVGEVVSKIAGWFGWR